MEPAGVSGLWTTAGSNPARNPTSKLPLTVNHVCPYAASADLWAPREGADMHQWVKRWDWIIRKKKKERLKGMRLHLEAFRAQVVQRCFISCQCGPSIVAVAQRHEWGLGWRLVGVTRLISSQSNLSISDAKTEKETEDSFFLLWILDQCSPVSNQLSFFSWFRPASRINLSFY